MILDKEVAMFRLLSSIVLVAACAICGQSFGHDFSGHFREFSIIFNGYGDEGFQKLCKSVSSGVDKDLPEAFRKAIGHLSGNHRVLGHGWTLDAAIPKETLEFLEATFPGKRGEIVEVWAQYVKHIKGIARSITGLHPAQADAFAAMLHDIHLLGDWEPGNVVTKYVLPPREIAEHFIKQSRILFRNEPEIVNAITKSLRSVTRRKLSQDVMAKAIIDTLGECKLGDKLHLAHPGMRIQYSAEVAKMAEMKLAHRILERVPGIKFDPGSGVNDVHRVRTTSRLPLSKKAFAKVTKSRLPYGSKILVPGLLTANGRLLVSLGSGVAEGLIVFAMDGGIASYSYVKGNINKAEYQEQLVDAAIKGVVVGCAVAVTVLLGAAPGGWIVIAVGIGTYVVTDFAIKLWRRNQDKKYLTLKDLEPFGIVPETTLDLNPETTLNLKFETPLDSKPETTLDLPPKNILDILDLK